MFVAAEACGVCVGLVWWCPLAPCQETEQVAQVTRALPYLSGARRSDPCATPGVWLRPPAARKVKGSSAIRRSRRPKGVGTLLLRAEGGMGFPRALPVTWLICGRKLRGANDGSHSRSLRPLAVGSFVGACLRKEAQWREWTFRFFVFPLLF